MERKFSSDLEIPKYLKRKENDISKANKKSKHKHQYEECLIRYKWNWEEESCRIKEINEEHERNKLLPEHLIWKPMYMNNMKVNPILGEYALIVKRNEEKLVVMKFTIIFQSYHVKTLQIDLSKEPERYILFERTYHDFYGPIDFSSDENKWENQSEEIEASFQTSRHVLAFFDWACLSDGDYGMFLCSFSTEEEAKEYALCYANANSHIAGNRNTMVTQLEPKEDHKRRVERYEAYQAYRKYYKEIMDVIVNFDGYPDYTSGGAPFLKEAILKEVPQITERQITLVWRDLPVVLEKRTQDVIEMERQNSMVQLQIIEDGDNDPARGNKQMVNKPLDEGAVDLWTAERPVREHHQNSIPE